jgi:hypothetical protein
MIDINKKYRTRDGREVRIYAVDGDEPRPVHGAHKSQTGWVLSCWKEDGVHVLEDYDLIEVKPRIQRTVWLALYPNEGVGFSPEVSMVKRDCLARVKVEIDCEEGEGL